MIEVEKKYWLHTIDEQNRIINLLNQKAQFVSEKEKNDRYFIKKRAHKDNLTIDEKDIIFRIRFCDGKYLITFKDKVFQEGAEINLEKEFYLDDIQAFDDFIQYIGFMPLIDKIKQVKEFNYKNVLLEYVHLNGLGYFLELEVLCQEEKHINQALSSINEVLNEFQVEEKNLETRMYIEMLLEKKLNK